MTLSTAPRRARAVLLAGCALVLLGFPSSAGAHATLQTSTPRWGAVLAAVPRVLTLVYDENVVPRYARVAVVTPSGQDLAGAPLVAGRVVAVKLRPGSRASYTVRWKMVASDDGHVTEGAFSFGVGMNPLPPIPAPGADVPVAPELLAWLEFIGVVLAGGTLTFRALVVAPPLQPATKRPHRTLESDWAGVGGAVLALHAGLLAFLVGAYPIVGGGGLNFTHALILPIRTGTHLGQAWTMMTFAWLGVLALLVGAWVTPHKREPLLASAGLLSLGIAFGISWASHPASRGALALAADYLHLWPARCGWGPVALAILAGDRASTTSPRTRGGHPRMRAAVLSACGAHCGRGRARRCVPSAARAARSPSLVTSGYGITLLAKSIVAVGALAIGGYHHRFVVPRIAAGAPVASMRRTLTLELSLLLLAVALAATSARPRRRLTAKASSTGRWTPAARIRANPQGRYDSAASRGWHVRVAEAYRLGRRGVHRRALLSRVLQGRRSHRARRSSPDESGPAFSG